MEKPTKNQFKDMVLTYGNERANAEYFHGIRDGVARDERSQKANEIYSDIMEIIDALYAEAPADAT